MASYLGQGELLTEHENLGNENVFRRVLYSEGDSDEESTIIKEEKFKVFLRLKPLDINYVDDTINTSNYTVDGKTLITKCTNQKYEQVNSTFHFTNVYLPSTTQEVIYNDLVRRNLYSFLLGDDCLIFAYGTSNSGKSYTMQGTGLNPGIIPRVLYSIFNSISGNEDLTGMYYPETSTTIIKLGRDQVAVREAYKKKLLSQIVKESHKKKQQLRQNRNDTIGCTTHQEMKDSLEAIPKIVLLNENNRVYSIWLSFAEIYNETLYDLFKDAHERQPLYLIEDEDKNNYIKGLTHINVHSWQEAYDLYRYGKNNLHMAQTHLNKQSSRSHCLFTIKLVIKDISSDVILSSSSFTICDLAGTERQKRAGTAGTMLAKEAQSINASLVVLNRCIEAIRNNQKMKRQQRIPFRESKLTRLLQNVLTGEGKITMVANISQDPTLFYETQQVLKMTADAFRIRIIANNPNDVLNNFKLKVREFNCKQEGVVQKQLTANKDVAICRHCGENKKIIEKLKAGFKNKEKAWELEKRRLLELLESKTESNIADVYQLNYEKLETEYKSYKKKTEEELLSYEKKVNAFEKKRDEYMGILEDALEVRESSLKAMIYRSCQQIQLLELMIADQDKNLNDLKDYYEKFLLTEHQPLIEEIAVLKGDILCYKEKLENLNLLVYNTHEEKETRIITVKEDIWPLDGNKTITVLKKKTAFKAKEGDNLSCLTQETAESLVVPSSESLVVPSSESLVVPSSESRLSTLRPRKKKESLVVPSSESLVVPSSESLVVPSSESLVVPSSESRLSTLRPRKKKESLVVPSSESRLSTLRPRKKKE